MTTWIHRLFFQNRSHRHDIATGRELGFSGMAAEVVIDDEYRLVALRRAETPHERLEAARMYLLKVLKNGSEVAGAHDDDEVLDLADQLRHELAEHMIIAADEMKKALESRGYKNLAYTRGIHSAPADVDSVQDS
ncbi:hypothetical protein AB0K12_37785 [Nonomuraea sp. NPDC049419]|uniref:hypothetical protein n=1 Tax=Nonomuraea sp. NPDC049419 TaxID=3155772 RepID=UPI003439BB45